MTLYARTMAIFYFSGFVLHLMDVFDLRLRLSTMEPIWTTWIYFLLVADLFAAVGLWQMRWWGFVALVFIACVQLVAYVGFADFFGPQPSLVIFHLLSLSLLLVLKIHGQKTNSQKV